MARALVSVDVACVLRGHFAKALKIRTWLVSLRLWHAGTFGTGVADSVRVPAALARTCLALLGRALHSLGYRFSQQIRFRFGEAHAFEQ